MDMREIIESRPYQQEAVRVVGEYIESHLEKTDPEPAYEVYVVWFAKVLQNWKALVSSTLPDGRYYEVTHDGQLGCTYVDVYVKVDNKTV